MKNCILVLTLLIFVACQDSKPKETTQSVATPTNEMKSGVKADTLKAAVYACPMDPEITGKKGDKCSKCGMALVEKK